MSETVEANWVSITRLGSSYDEEIDANAKPTRMRHRLHRFTGETIDDWKDGPSPTPRPSPSTVEKL